MNQPASRAPELVDERVDELLDRWEAARERSIDLSAEVLCANDPELLPRVSEKLALLIRMEGRMSRSAGETCDPLLEDDNPTLGVSWGCRLIRLLAEGGLGRVYLAKDLQIERLLAVKFLKPGLKEVPEQVERFLVEAKLTGALGHPGIVPILGIGRTHDDLPFYVMPLIEGRTMADAIDAFHQSSIDDPQRYLKREFRDLLRSFVALCQAIAFAHEHRVLHRDVKPQNVILGPFGQTIVIDWGLATLLPRESPDQTNEEKKLLATTLRVRRKISAKEGTLPYMSPELHLGLEEVQPSSDVYALGITLFRMLTGRLPVETTDRRRLIVSIVSGELPTPIEVLPSCPPRLSQAVVRATSLSSTQRHSSCLELAEEIETWLREQPAGNSENKTSSSWTRRWFGGGSRVDHANPGPSR